MTEEPNAKQANKPNAASKEQQVVQELLEKLGLHATPTQPTGCAADSTGGVTVGCARAADVADQHSEGLEFVGWGRRKHVPNQQLPTPAVATAQSVGGGSVVVDCRYCGGCCGGLSGRRLPARVVELIRLVEDKLDLRYECQVVNRYPELFCRRIGRRGHGLNRVKELERLLSREGEYKASYVLERLRECRHDAVCWRYLRLGVEGWFRFVHLLANRAPGDVDAYFARLVRGLGFSGVAEFARYLRLIDQGLIDFNYTNRGRGYRDVLSVRCRICGGDIGVTGPLPSVLARLIRHFRVEHGLKAISDVEAKIKELEERETSRPEGDDAGVVLLRHSGEVTQLVRLVVHRLTDAGLLERFGKVYRCRVCNADVGNVINALAHVMNHHYGIINKLLSGRPTPSARGINETVDELANLFSSGNPDAVKPTVKALVQGVVEVLDVKGSISIPMLTRWLNDDDNYRPLIDSLTTGSLRPERVVSIIVEALARHGLVHVDGEVVRVGD
ncbi:MAG: hypothetical protein RXN91_09290 [Caldivirga sp.]